MYEIKLQQTNVSVCHDTLNFITALILTQIENHFLLFQLMHTLYTLTLKSHIKMLNICPYMFRSLLNHPQGACKQHFTKLLRWDLLIYIHYKIVQFVAICLFIQSIRME